jgi:NADPH:quinone reductase-like Zn-dependent oxidoreductase
MTDEFNPEEYKSPTVQRDIDGFVYTSEKVPAIPSTKLLARVIRLLGARGLQVIIGHVAPKAFAKIAKALTPETHLVAIEELAVSYLTDPQVFYDLMVNVRVNKLRSGGEGGALQKCFDTHFAGELPHMIEVAAFVLRHNFSGFTIGSHWISGSLTGTPPETATGESSG